MEIVKLKSEIERLNTKQKLELINYIKSSYSVFNDYASVEKCPHCGSVHFIKYGIRKDVIRYMCKDCNKTFTYKSNTILSGIQKLNKWNDFVEDFITLNISSIKDICEKLNISNQTAIDWRHKLLSALITKETKFKNESIEFDETYFLISRKGRKDLNIGNKSAYRYWRKSQVGDSKYNVKMFFSYGRETNKLDLFTSHMGRTSTKDLENYFISNKFSNIVAITDKHITYSSFFHNHNIEQKTFLAKQHINYEDKSVHNQTINAYMRDFKDFVNKSLRGVSSKYIQFYAKWYEFITNTKKEIRSKLETKSLRFNLTEVICNNVVENKIGLEMFRQSEFSFNQFLKANGRSNFGTCKHHYYAKVS